MRIAVPHNTDKATARRKIEDKLEQVLATYGHYLSDSQHRWEGDRLLFSGKAKGMKAEGTVDVTDSEVIIDGKLPLLAKPFEPRIKNQIEREAAAMFRTA
ncbi:MAG TPA: polyhydroxyalkanoic acid system family protein [Thermoanaerobaculia bacterium]|nr:polyhydroxyalkanoic acid system family protein [Thermoanaerobaculia bacterium]